jgi:mRNA interferase RelE/StbE
LSQPEFAIVWTSPATRALVRLPGKAASAVVALLYGSVSQNPQRVGRALSSPLDGLHSARRGDYRVIYRIDARLRRVTVVAIGHRSDIYRRR